MQSIGVAAVTAFTAHREWATRPPDERFASVSTLYEAARDRRVRTEERVLLLLLDTPEFAYCFFGAIKIGALPVPANTLLKPPDYRHLLNDSRARVAVVSEALLPQILAIPRSELPFLLEVVVVGEAPPGTRSFADFERWELERGTGADQ